MIHSRQSPGGHMTSFSPYLDNIAATGISSPYRGSSSGSLDLDKYLSELLSERQKLGPFMQVLPNCSRLLNQEIIRLTNILGTSSIGEQDALDHASLLSSPSVMSNGVGFGSNGWSSFQAETSSITWRGFPGVVVAGGSPSPIVKKIIRIEVPVDKYPNFNFVGRLLGPRGNSLKRVESITGCRVFIRGRGSVRDSDKEEKLLEKPGCEHLNEPLHVLVEAVQPANIIDIHLNHAKEIIEDLLKPVDESHDYFKKQQLRELAMLNGTLREDSPSWSGNNSPYSNSGMKRPKTRV